MRGTGFPSPRFGPERDMSDLIEIIKQLGYRLDIGYWMIDVDKRILYWPKGLGLPEGQEGDRRYFASGIDRVLERILPADQGRFRTFLAEILRTGEDATIEITIDASWGGRVQLRLAGRRVGQGKDTRIVGLIEVINRWREAERLAKSLSFIIEALFISSDSGIVIFDGQLRVRRLNRHALELFGIDEAHENTVDWGETIEKTLPRSTRELLLEAIANSSAVSGTIALAGLGGPRLSWRANPWGIGDGDLSGLVMVVEQKKRMRTAMLAEHEALAGPTPPSPAPIRVAPPPPEPRPAPPVMPEGHPDEAASHRHRALEWVKHPILLVSITTAEVVFANRAAREAFAIPGDHRTFVENVFDVSGFACEIDTPRILASGGHMIHLVLGARVGRMVDYDDDLLFVEYHEISPHHHPHTAPRTLAVAASKGQPVVARPAAR